MNIVKATLILLLVIGMVATASARLHPVQLGNPNAPMFPMINDAAVTNPTSPTNVKGNVRGPVRSIDETDAIWQVGTTYSDFFSYGGYNRMIARDSRHALHVAWMNARQPGSADRVVSYNFRFPPDSLGGRWYSTTGSPAFAGNGAGFSSMDVLRNNKAAIAVHRFVGTGNYPTIIGVDDQYLSGAFIETPIPRPTGFPNDTIIWPVMTVDNQNRIHVVGRNYRQTNGYNKQYYSRTDSLSSNPQTYSFAFNTYSPSYCSATSRISGKVAIAWPNTAIINGYNVIGGWRGYLASQYNNDLWIAQSLDNGQTWNFGDTLHNNITKFRTWDATRYAQTVNMGNPDTVWAAGDTFRFAFEMAMVYDNQDYLHVVFVCPELMEDFASDTMSTHRAPVKRMSDEAALMYHWTDAPGLRDTFSIVADGWNRILTASYGNQAYRQSWAQSIARMSLSVASNNGELFCAFNYFAQDDTAANGRGCGRVYVTHSINNGLSWYYPIAISDSNTLGGDTLTAHNGIWPSMPEVVDNDSLYIMYIDRRAGGSASNGDVTNWTRNQVYVKSIARTSLRSDSSLLFNADPTLGYPALRRQDWYHPYGVADTKPVLLPYDYKITAFPNPFNPVTNVKFTIATAGRVTVKVYDVSGREVATLANDNYKAGTQNIQWRPFTISSGVYFIRMVAGNQVRTDKVVLLK